MIADIVYPLLNIDVRTLVAVLFWGNLISVLLVVTFKFANPYSRDKALSHYYVIAKAAQSLAYFLLFFRGLILPVLSVNLGNSLLLLGFYWEAVSMLLIIKEESPRIRKLIRNITIASILTFNFFEIALPDSPSLRVFVASICVFLVLFIPTLKMLIARNMSNFKRMVSLFYLMFLSMLLPRAVHALSQDIHVLSNTFIQTMTYLSLVLLMIFSLSAYLLLMKEETDRIIHKMATTDALTGLYNRYNFLFLAQRIFERHKINQTELTAIFFDIDNFKKVNDIYGHSFGDQVLVACGNILAASLRPADLLCRYGGEEFVVLLPASGSAAAQSVAGRVMDSLKNFKFEQYPDLIITVSAGICSAVPKKGSALQEIIGHADLALNMAKKTGKNKTVDYADMQ